jgi:hypothetical protein
MTPWQKIELFLLCGIMPLFMVYILQQLQR